MMKSSELVAKVVDIAKHYKTLYVMGCFGAPLTDTNKSRYIKNHSYNMAAARTSMIMAATPDTFGFDCVNLIKAVLWGWTGDKTKSYGGAKYATNGVPDEGADTMIKRCKDASASGWDKVDPAKWCGLRDTSACISETVWRSSVPLVGRTMCRSPLSVTSGRRTGTIPVCGRSTDTSPM